MHFVKGESNCVINTNNLSEENWGESADLSNFGKE